MGKENMSNLATVIAIVPRLPPAIDGVGDYALNLAKLLIFSLPIKAHRLLDHLLF